VVSALRADVERLLEIGAIEHRLAHFALDPQAFRDSLLGGAGTALDLGR
jgi:hypothetical protein